MPYCQECGSHIEQDINTCSNCGNKLLEAGATNAASSETDPEITPLKADGIATPSLNTLGEVEYPAAIPKESFTEPGSAHQGVEPDQNSFFTENQGEFIPQEGLSMGSHRSQIESHLGKGLIKPVVVENCMDGFHFKYDEPPRQITKPEPQKEKVVEFRFSGESEPSVEAKEISEAMEKEKDIKDPPEDIGMELQEAQAVDPEIIAEPEHEIELDAEDNGEDLTLVEEGGLPESELIPEIESPEPEIRSATEPEVIWEGHRTWNGLTLKEVYRITDQSIILLGGDGQIIKEVEWRSVSEIALQQNWLAKLLNLGNLVLIGLGFEPLLILEGIDHPEQLQKMLVETICSKV